MHQAQDSRRLGSPLAGGATLILGALLVGVACSSPGTSDAPEDTAPARVPTAQHQTVETRVPRAEPLASRGMAPTAATAIPQQRRLTTPFATRPVGGAARDDATSELALWAERRAFDGAPPVIPHSNDYGRGATTCLDCHLAGMSLGQRVARPMSHPVLSGCEQCHVESAHSWLPPTPAPENSFVGLALPAPGPRDEARISGAPPTIPHTLWMRGNCLACHGAFGFSELRTSHPERANCVQCHVARQGVSR